MYFTSGSDRAFEQLMQGKPGFDHYDSGEAVTPEDCGTCRFYRPHWKYQFCVYAECPYQPGKLTAYDAVTFRVKGVENMAVFRVERNKGYTVMSNHHLRNKDLSLKAKGLLECEPRWRKERQTLPCRPHSKSFPVPLPAAFPISPLPAIDRGQRLLCVPQKYKPPYLFPHLKMFI